ncbi:uncharacterized protein I206_105374 [Kwoniella pini CBS 10737]|uniref:Mnn4-regulates the mannosylphosphorylation n=1 Tax=Kwoniella pini CBS 10737 TaxID=1296096 RepID=A0A1B9I4G4_9TREE|nr:uncharacterized protein I206_03718 [Kwoniella pini CBS 10737]OCF50397.1 hypothetical protein I206_03718 [Kwoniella pini CBS 10737]
MNRTLALSGKRGFLLPIRPKPSPLPSNLARPKLPITPSSQLTVAQALFPQLRGSGIRFYAKQTEPGDKEHPQSKGPNPGPNPETIHISNREDQNSTSGAAAELKGMTKDFASLIAGSSPQAQGLGAREVSAQGGSHGSIAEDFYSVTKGMFTSVPKPVLYTGLAGTIPYLGTSLSIVALAREASLAAASGGESPAGLDLATCLSYLHTMEHIQITYGAIILSFLGALHWGMEFAKLGGEQGYQRLLIGIVPVLAAWPTLLASHGIALAAQWFGFTGMWFLDQRAAIAGWTTNWYSTYRFYLSIIVGFSIIGTLVGTSIYGAGAGAITDPTSPHLNHTTERTSALKRLDRVKEKNFPTHDKNAKVNRVEGKVAGPIQVEESNESFLKLRNIEKEEQEAKEAEEKEKKEKQEEEKKQKEQDEKENKQKESSKGMKSGSKDREGGENEKDQGKKKAAEQGADKQSEGVEKEQDKEGDDKGGEEKDESKDEQKGDEKEDKQEKSNDNQGGDNKDDKQEKAAKEKGAAGDENTGMR